MMKRFYLLLLALLYIGVEVSLAQAKLISGTVTDKIDGSSLPGVAILVKGTSKGTATDIDGKYSIEAKSGDVLVFSYVGKKTTEIKVGDKSVVNVALEPDSETLEEVIVTGYGIQRKGSFTGSAAVLGADKINSRTDANPVKALEGAVAGVQMNIGSGQPGAPANIFIRGRNSLNSGTQPLYVIDGVPFETGVMGVRKSSGVETSPLSTLNPSDIESMTVLKDATATSIYGARAANGVIVITTKKGQQGKVKVNVSLKGGFEDMSNYPDSYKLLNRDQYVELMTEGYMNTGKPDYATEEAAMEKVFSQFNLKPGEGPDVDWMDEVTRKGSIYDFNIDISAGGENEKAAKYYLSFNYFKNEGVIIGKDLERYAGRFNLDHAPSDFVKYGFNSSFSYTDINMGTGGGYFSDPITMAYGKMTPLMPVYTETGDWNFEENPFNNGAAYNPVAQRSEYGDKSNSKQYRGIVSPYLTLSFNDALSFTSRGGLDLYSLKEFGYWSFLQPQGASMRGLGEQGTNTRTLLSITNTLNWLKSFGDHNWNMLIGQEAQHTRVNASYLAGTNYPNETLNQVSLTAVPGSASTDLDNVAIASFFMNANYNFASKYFLSGSVRTDGSSRFGENNRWATFYSIGARYRITGESFMEPLQDWLTNLTVRTSFGTAGNQDVGGSWYASRSLFGFGYNYNGAPGSAPGTLDGSIYKGGNPDLRWELTEKFNAGLDLGFFDNRLSLEFDYYHHKTKDMVFNVPVSFTTGLMSVPQNIGELKNTGIEFKLSGDVVRIDKVNWNVTLVGSHNKNEMIKLSNDLPIEGGITIIEPGKDIYTFKMKEWAGVDPETGNPLWWKVQRDENGNEVSREKTSVYTQATKEYVGSASPKFQGSISSALNLHGFDLSFQLNYSMGGKIYGNNLHYDEQCGQSGLQNTTQYVYDNRWQTPGQITDVPKFVNLNNSSANGASSRFLMNGDYLKIRNIAIGYTFPKSMISKLSLSSLRIYASADNLYTFSSKDFRGFDPSGIDADGIQWWNYPTPRNIMFGLNIGF